MLRGALSSALETPLSVKSYVQLVPALCDDVTLAYRVAWS
jgi:hypothetical protein